MPKRMCDSMGERLEPSITRRRLLSGAAATLGAVNLSIAPANSENAAKPDPVDGIKAIEITARPFRSFERTGAGGHRYGKLEFRGGLVLTSPDKAFGGLSGLVLEPDGRKFLAVSDETGWLSGEIVYQGTAPVGIKNSRMGPIKALAGRTLDRKRDLDAEAMTLLDGNLTRGHVLVGFERNHRIGKFPVIDSAISGPSSYLKLPPDARRMRQNRGFEAVAAIHNGPMKGAIIAFSERFPDNPGFHTGWFWINGEPQRVTIPDVDDFDVTDAASLPDGGLLILERRFRWSDWMGGIKMRLRRIASADLRPGSIARLETLLEANLSNEIDNMEGLAVHRGPKGEVVLTMLSDDNFNSFLQRTILLQFTLSDAVEQTARP